MASHNDEMINALDTLRRAARRGPVDRADLTDAINALDNAGIFAVIDNMTGYDVNPEPVHAHQAGHLTGSVNPAEWGDTTRADMAQHQGVPLDYRRHYVRYPGN